jgi:hypothetical protein
MSPKHSQVPHLLSVGYIFQRKHLLNLPSNTVAGPYVWYLDTHRVRGAVVRSLQYPQ